MARSISDEGEGGGKDAAEMTSGFSIPWNPEGTVGVAVGDGAYNSEESTAQIRQSALEYLSRAGLNVAPMPLKGMGAVAGEIILAIATGLAADILVHVWKQVREFFRSWLDRNAERLNSRHRVECTVQLGDRRGPDRDAVQLLLLLPGLREHLDQEHPNRSFSFVVFSATSHVDFVQVILRDYDDLKRTSRQVVRIIRRLPESKYASFFLQDGPFGSRRVTFNAV